MKGIKHNRTIYRPTSQRNSQRSRLPATALAWLLLPTYLGLELANLATLTQAQPNSVLQKQEDQLIRQFTPPPAPPPAPVYRPVPAPAPVYRQPQTSSTYYEPAPAASSQSASVSTASTKSASKPEATDNDMPMSQYVMEFNRSPIVGNSLRLKGVYSEGRLNFTRPRHWNLKSIQAVIRYQHSPALVANRSNLTVRVNGRSVGSVPLNRKQSQIGEFTVNIPPNIIQNENEITLVAQQNNSPTCSNPADETLWTEILPDSKLLFNFQPKSIPLDFSRYPYPFFDELSLDANQITYLLPNKVSESWLTSAAQFQAGIGRLADYRRVNTRLVSNLDQAKANQPLVVIGTPQEQSVLKTLNLPYKMTNNQFVDGNKAPLPDDVGLLMLTTTRDSGVPVLVVTGNSAEGVAKAAHFLLQPKQRQMGTGSAILVDQLTEAPTPPVRQWPGYLPAQNTFRLSDLQRENNKPWQDTTVRGTSAPPVVIDFRAQPDEQLQRGSNMTLFYSYGPQVNPRMSSVDVQVDGVSVGGQRLTNDKGESRASLNVDLPANLIRPDSKIQVAFNLIPKQTGECGQVADQQLWGTVHSDTRFNVKRDTFAKLPDLKLLKAGYPFAAPQDLSTTAIALPDAPSNDEILTLLQVSERLGRISQSDGIKLQAYTASTLPETVRREANLIGIGNRERFPLVEALQSGGFELKDLYTRRENGNQIQTLPDAAGVVRQVVSPWNPDRVVLALTAQTNAGLNKVQDLFKKDILFFQLKDDTVVVNTTVKNPSEYNLDDYSLSFFQKADRQARVESGSLLSRSSRWLQENWFLIPTGMVMSSLMLYGVAQLYLKRVDNSEGDS